MYSDDTDSGCLLLSRGEGGGGEGQEGWDVRMCSFLFHMAIIVEGMGECSSFWAWEGKKEFASIDHALQENPCY